MREAASLPSVLIWIRSDPTVSGRVNEALRQGVGLAGSGLPVSFYLEGPAARILSEDPLEFVDGEDIERHLSILRGWNVLFHSAAADGSTLRAVLAPAERFIRF